MTHLLKTLAAATLLSSIYMAPVQAANQLTINGTLNKLTGGTTFDTWKFKILGTGTFTVDVAAYEASQSNINTAGYYTHDINGDGELTWLDADTYFYHNTGNALAATDAIVRCDDTANNCAVYQNGLTAATSPLVVTTHQQSEPAQDGSVHFRRDPWFDVSVVAPGDYLYLVADYLLSPAEAATGINGGDNFSVPTGFTSPITNHADYRVTFSSDTLAFSLSGNTITVSQVPVPAAAWLFGSALFGLVGITRRKSPAMA